MTGAQATVSADPKQLYTERITRARAEAERLAARSRLVSNLRGLSFGVAVVSTIAAIAGAESAICVPLALVAAAFFFGLVVLHARVIDEHDLAERSVDVNHEAISRLEHDFKAISDAGEGLAPPEHPYAADLDLFGRGSLYQRLSVARTRFGRERLAELLLAPATLEAAGERQGAVRALARELDLRQRFEAHALGVAGTRRRNDGGRAVRSAPNPEALLRWAESEPSLIFDPITVWGSRILPPLSVAGLVGYFGFGLSGAFALATLALQAILLARSARETQRVFAAVSSTEGAFLRYSTLLALIENFESNDPLLAALRQKLQTDAGAPSEAMSRFRRWVGWFDLRHNGIVHFFVNPVLLWDVHCTAGLERWQQQAGKRLRGWFEVIGWFEALSSIAGFAADEPSVIFPELVDGPAVFEAEALAHPLIAPSRRVPNDVVLSGARRALLITGSNMSGKSTLLRAVGLSTVLALAGAPVCARSLRLSRLSLQTSIRVADSLERGVSHFYAEITRLKHVVDAAGSGSPVLFLLDEILHGTNSRERQVGARWVLAELLRRGAIGAISTHDEELCRLPEELMDKVALVHLRESVTDGKMSFDYRVYDGPVTSGNALRLMRLVGLDVPLA